MGSPLNSLSRRRGWWLLIAWLFAAAATVRADGPSVVSVYIPGYGNNEWEAYHGSIISSDASVTTYTIFCAEQAPTCRIAGDLPFIIAEGPKTLRYGGTAAGTITANLHCDLAGTTAATCTGSSSFGPSYSEGGVTGPTQTSWTKTFSGSAVTWAALTITTPGPGTDTTNIEGPADATQTVGGGGVLSPSTTSAAGLRPRAGGIWATVASMGALMAMAIGCLAW
ncbi:hypothetical protein B0T22DRAFT_478658 [Podospora appendiculata]|uniref:Uncharacterized protein n=1 Tax=Podospora appendiculata TaxID=314037 RepID=A0AAE0X793_9PEZI|nr:hypothetical protein B0T22DRAFT_478658 [Podospora appendiculata]